MNQYFNGFFTAICLSISFVMFTASKSSDLGDITVNSIRVVDNQNGGFITTYNRLGELTSFIGVIEDGSGKIASYDKNKVQYSIRSVADKDRKQNEELLNRLREDLIEDAIDQLTKFEDDIKDNKSMIVENTQEIHQAFEAIMENTEFSRHTKETLTKRIMELYGPY